MKTRKYDRVQYKYDPNDWRRRARIEMRKKERKAERKVLLQQAIATVIFFLIMVHASGVLA